MQHPTRASDFGTPRALLTALMDELTHGGYEAAVWLFGGRFPAPQRSHHPIFPPPTGHSPVAVWWRIWSIGQRLTGVILGYPAIVPAPARTSQALR